MIKIFTSYLLMIAFIVFQWLWLFLPNEVIWSIEEIDPNYLIKSRRLDSGVTTLGVMNRKDYMRSHEGYFWFKVSDFIYDWKHEITSYVTTVGLFLLFSTLIYRKYLRLYTPTYVLGEAIGILYILHIITIAFVSFMTVILYGAFHGGMF